MRPAAGRTRSWKGAAFRPSGRPPDKNANEGMEGEVEASHRGARRLENRSKKSIHSVLKKGGFNLREIFIVKFSSWSIKDDPDSPRRSGGEEPLAGMTGHPAGGGAGRVQGSD